MVGNIAHVSGGLALAKKKKKKKERKEKKTENSRTVSKLMT